MSSAKAGLCAKLKLRAPLRHSLVTVNVTVCVATPDLRRSSVGAMRTQAVTAAAACTTPACACGKAAAAAAAAAVAAAAAAAGGG
jgi:hypothetical protein